MISDQPLVSIITPVYNGARYLTELITSVRSQDYPGIEHIVIDDGSDDDGATAAILNSFPNLRSWRHAHRGQYATMNEGLQAARGEVVCFVSADDLVAPGAVRRVVERMQVHPEIAGVYGSSLYIDELGGPYRLHFPFRNAPLSFYPFFTHVDHCSLYIQRRILVEHQLYFDPHLSFAGDYDWILRMLEAHLVLKRIDARMSSIRIHSDQASQASQAAMRAEKRLVANRHRVNKPLYSILTATYIFLAARISWAWRRARAAWGGFFVFWLRGPIGPSCAGLAGGCASSWSAGNPHLGTIITGIPHDLCAARPAQAGAARCRIWRYFQEHENEEDTLRCD